MNRAGAPRYSAPSKATPNTVCQKCLQKGHYSYECTSSAQQRPYKARPSRTQQLLNPTLAPRLSEDVPNELMRKKGVADELLVKAEAERGRQRDRNAQSRSPSTSSSTSVATVSTNKSRSPSPPPRNRKESARDRSLRRERRLKSPSDSPERRRRNARRRSKSRSASPARRDYRSSRRLRSPAENRPAQRSRDEDSFRSNNDRKDVPPRRQRSMSPYSKRIALTQAMNL